MNAPGLVFAKDLHGQYASSRCVVTRMYSCKTKKIQPHSRGLQEGSMYPYGRAAIKRIAAADFSRVYSRQAKESRICRHSALRR
jgi:hypothetical protein